jgi:subtilisin family serine protease
MCSKNMWSKDRRPNKHLIVGLTISTAIAVVVLVVTTASQAAQLNSFSVGPRAPMTMRTPSFSSGGTNFRSEPRFQRFNNNIDKVVTDDGKVKGKGKGSRTKVSTTDQGDGRPGHRPPKKPPGLVPIIGTGVAIGTGVVLGTDPAGAGLIGTGPAGGGTPPPGGIAAPRIYIPPVGEERFVKDELVLEFFGAFPPAGIVQVLRRQGLVQLESQYFSLTNSTIVRARITNGLPVRVALPRVGTETTLLFGQPNFLFQQSQQVTAPPEATKATPVMATAAAIPAIGDPAQYALGKLRIGEAHTLATGERVLVAVIDSGIDLSHPELAGVIVGSFDAIGKSAPPHQHGTAIAGAIASHARLMGAAPAAKILAIRAFGASGASAEATTMAILKSIQYASLQQARIINMSFAGPADPNLSRELAAAKAKGTVLIAASGNFGPKSPPQYPAADPNVIAVSATDVDDKIFGASNIGPHIAVAAPGVDILLPSPGNDYRLISGTSFSAAYVSGVAALIIQRAPGLSPDAVRNILQSTAKDLGPVGKDPEYGAGLVDAYQAIMAVQANATAEVTPTPQAQTEQAKAQ